MKLVLRSVEHIFLDIFIYFTFFILLFRSVLSEISFIFIIYGKLTARIFFSFCFSLLHSELFIFGPVIPHKLAREYSI